MVYGGCTLYTTVRSILYSTYCKCLRTVYTSTHSYHAIESRSPIKISDVVMMGDEKIENPMVMGERRRQKFYNRKRKKERGQ